MFNDFQEKDPDRCALWFSGLREVIRGQRR